MNAPHKPDPDTTAAAELPDISARPPFFGTGVVYRWAKPKQNVKRRCRGYSTPESSVTPPMARR